MNLQLLSQGKAAGVQDTLSLDIHAITELQNKKIPPTDDSFKYKYKARSDAKDADYGKIYCKYFISFKHLETTFIHDFCCGHVE